MVLKRASLDIRSQDGHSGSSYRAVIATSSPDISVFPTAGRRSGVWLPWVSFRLRTSRSLALPPSPNRSLTCGVVFPLPAGERGFRRGLRAKP
eukprot:scaffold439_cov415-Prasinococcus_capsulatus_cf.AAC.12